MPATLRTVAARLLGRDRACAVDHQPAAEAEAEAREDNSAQPSISARTEHASAQDMCAVLHQIACELEESAPGFFQNMRTLSKDVHDLPRAHKLTITDLDSEDEGSTGDVQDLERIHLRVLQLLPCLTQLRALDMAHVALGTQEAGALAAALPSMAHLQVLVLYGTALSEQASRVLAPGLACCTGLRRLQVAQNLTETGLSHEFLQAIGSLTQLWVVELVTMVILPRPEGDQAREAAFCNALMRLTCLQELNLSKSQLPGNDAYVCIAASLHAGGQSTVRDINLHDNCIWEERGLAVARELKHCTSLTSANLSKNGIAWEAQNVRNELAFASNLWI